MKQGSSAFWSLDTDLQLGYEIYDRCTEINALIQAIATLASRNDVIQTEEPTKSAISGLSVIANQLRNSPVGLFNEISNAASSRSNSESWHLQKIKTANVYHVAALNILLNSTGPLTKFTEIVEYNLVESMRYSLIQVKNSSEVVVTSAEIISDGISKVRENSSLLLTPELLSEFVGRDVSERMTASLIDIRDAFVNLMSEIRDVGRLTVAHGSIHELLSRSYAKDSLKRNITLNNFIINYDRVRSNLMTSVDSYRHAAKAGIQSFITKVQTTFSDSTVRPKFETQQLPQIQSFADMIVYEVYNQTLFETSFDEMRDSIVYSFLSTSKVAITKCSEYREAVWDLQRSAFVQRYPQCLNELVTEAQEAFHSVTSKYASCLDERTSDIAVIIPSTSTWLSAIRDTLNFILQQLNGCLNGQISALGLSDISECIQGVSETLVLINFCNYRFLKLISRAPVILCFTLVI